MAVLVCAFFDRRVIDKMIEGGVSNVGSSGSRRGGVNVYQNNFFGHARDEAVILLLPSLIVTATPLYCRRCTMSRLTFEV